MQFATNIYFRSFNILYTGGPVTNAEEDKVRNLVSKCPNAFYRWDGDELTIMQVVNMRVDDTENFKCWGELAKEFGL